MTKQEKMFCEIFAATLDKERAAKAAGFVESPEIFAQRLFSKAAVRKRCKRLIKSSLECQSAVAGLSKLVFGNASSAVEAFFEEGVPSLKNADLFCISEIKRSSTGAVEIKFFDKIRALQTLAELCPTESENKMQGFYEAIIKGATASDDRSDEE